MATKRKNSNSYVREWMLLARGMLALFWKRADLQPLIDSDFERELSTNIYLAHGRRRRSNGVLTTNRYSKSVFPA
jgi:hypothetical protein